MAAADTAKLVAALTLDARGFNAGVKSATGSLGKLESTVGNIGRRAQAGIGALGKNLALIGVGAGAAIAVAVKSGLSDLSKLNSAIVSVDSAISSVGATGQITGKEVADWANQIESDIGAAFDDKDITAAAATLLRFGKVAPKNLKPALVVMTDLATKTGDIDSAASLLAKALADPTKAAGKLARAGVVLTKAQQATIKEMIKQNDTAGAQQVILDALSKTTAGAAAGSQDKYARSLSILNDVAEDARKALAEGFLPVIERVADLLSKQLRNPAFLQGIREFGNTLAGGLDDLVSIAQRLPWGAIGDSLKIAGAGAKAVLNAFVSLPPWVQTAVLTGWGLNKLTGGALGGIVGELGKGLIKGVLGMNAGVVNINAGVVNGVGGGAPGLPTGAAGPGIGVLASAPVIGGAVAVGTLQVAAKEINTSAAVALGIPPEAAQKIGDAAAAGLPGPQLVTVLGKIGPALDELGTILGPKTEVGKRDPNAITNAKNAQQLVHAAERAEATRAAQTKEITSKIGDGTSETKGALGKTSAEQAAASARLYASSEGNKTATTQASAKAAVDAAQQKSVQDGIKAQAAATAAAVREKDLSVKLFNYLTVNTRISVANDLNAKNNYKSVYRIAQ